MGAGNDVFYNLEVGDTVDGGSGYDVILTNIANFSLVDSENQKNLEGVRFYGSNNAVLTGNEFDNLIVGGGGDDLIIASKGNDTILGGFGVDTLSFSISSNSVSVSNNFLAQVWELGNGVSYFWEIFYYGSINYLHSNNITYYINIHTNYGVVSISEDVEYVTFTDGKILSVSGTINESRQNGGYTSNLVFATQGSSSADTLLGSDKVDMLDGKNGDDTLLGMGGDDIIRGGAGNDLIYGGLGSNTIFGDAGNDIILVHNQYDIDLKL